jgi:hypothetical protein
MRIRKLAAALGLTCAFSFAAVAPALAAAPAAVPTQGCAHGVYTGYCGLRTDGAGFTLYVSGPVNGGQVRGEPDTGTLASAKPGFDFYWFAYDGGGTKVAEYAPAGVASGLCLTQQPGTAILTVDTCTGSQEQQWTAALAADGGYTWANAASGDIIHASPLGQHFAAGLPAPAAPNGTYTFTFEA